MASMTACSFVVMGPSVSFYIEADAPIKSVVIAIEQCGSVQSQIFRLADGEDVSIGTAEFSHIDPSALVLITVTFTGGQQDSVRHAAGSRAIIHDVIPEPCGIPRVCFSELV